MSTRVVCHCLLRAESHNIRTEHCSQLTVHQSREASSAFYVVKGAPCREQMGMKGLLPLGKNACVSIEPRHFP